ncbi:hypothetical protein BDW59DRAFT_177241 [Aspergillus cavernicola]|uniref:NACHT domain-containing protein n=1 Tax=Aspergillus cavernicola TaxID=176166 RepID=A0ABR4J5H1_9EURO
MEKYPLSSSSNVPTTFEKAFTEYLTSLPDKKNTKRMIFDGLTTSGQVDPGWIQSFVEETENKMSRKTSVRIFNRIVKPMVTAIREYYGIIDTMCQASPFAAGLIWGALKIVFDCADRFSSLFETIKQQLQDLTFHLERINYFDDLYKDASMQSLLCHSYINVLRFWTRVRKECERNTFNLFLKSATPFSTNKMDSVILDLKKDAEEIRDRADMLEKVQRYDRVKQWLSVRGTFQDTLEANHRRHDSNRASRVPGTSEWIFETAEFQEWAGKTPGSPIIWISGGPGTGKSMLCSRVIQHIQDTHPSAAIAFHFFRFDQESSAIDLLRVMTGQLLESLRQCTQDVPDSVLSITETLGASVNNIMDMLRAITSSPSLPTTFLFIDGLDEELSEQRWLTARQTLQMLITLVTLNSEKSVRLWLSSQAHNAILKTMEHYRRIHVVDQNERDIRLLFENGMRELEQELEDIDTTAEEREHWFELLKEKARGNFLWAHYIIHSISEEAESIADIEWLIEHSLPKDLNEYYRRQFKRIPISNRNLASKIFSIVRLVSVSELRDAIGVIRNPNASSKSDIDRRRPRLKLIQNLICPLIVEENVSDGAEKRCRLFHSTVKEFVKKNPHVLSESEDDVEDVSIGPSTLAELCLLYLSQPRYSSLLEKFDSEWRMACGDSPDRDAFLRYSAKYWYYHLEGVSPSTDLAERISAFLESSNFQTLLQVQHLYVDSQFSVFTMIGRSESSRFLKRALPNWFVRMAAQNPKLHFSQDYRVFLHEWSYLLACGCCDCEMARYAGQIDRCLFGALGASNFMSSMRSRYPSFALSTGDKDGIRTAERCYEGYSACGHVVYLIQFVSRCHHSSIVSFVCETWRLDEFGKPRLQRRQRLEVDEEQASWNLYFKNDINVTVGRAKAIAFDYDARGLRIGSQLHVRDDNGLFQKLDVNDDQKERFPPYFEEFLCQGKYVIVASRRRAPVPSEKDFEDTINDPVNDVVKLFDNGWESDDSNIAGKDERSSESSESDPSSSSTTGTGLDWTSGDETWSEASTEIEDAIDDENAIAVFRGYVDSSNNSDSDSTEPSSASDDGSEPDSAAGLGATPYARFLCGFLDDDSDGDDAYVPFPDSDGDSDGSNTLHLQSRYGRLFRKKTKKGDSAVSLKVFSISGTELKCIFQLSKPLHLMLYDSAPVLHPFQPLIIWPMSPGNVLFADFEHKTWFRRKLRPTNTFTRQVFTKCHFSQCGKYLHIAILEARMKPPKDRKRDKTSSNTSKTNRKIPLQLSLFVTTHRLSMRKTTRAPPTQIYRTKIELGFFHSLPVSQLPFSLTWTSSELYFTQSKTALTVFKIKLFPPLDGEEPVLVPREKIFLPATAATREVRFFHSDPEPSTTNGDNNKDKHKGTMHVLMGSEIRSSRVLLGEGNPVAHSDEGGFKVEGTAWIPQIEAVRGVEGSVSMPAGLYLSSAEDFGGWVRSADIVDVPADSGVGQLDLKVERFDIEEDCDLEPYII